MQKALAGNRLLHHSEPFFVVADLSEWVDSAMGVPLNGRSGGRDKASPPAFVCEKPAFGLGFLSSQSTRKWYFCKTRNHDCGCGDSIKLI